MVTARRRFDAERRGCAPSRRAPLNIRLPGHSCTCARATSAGITRDRRRVCACGVRGGDDAIPRVRGGRRLDRARELKRAFYGPRHRTLALRGDDLSARERQVARLAVDGLTAREIGEQLFISSRTVETHLANVYAKLGVRSKIELVGRASELALNQ